MPYIPEALGYVFETIRLVKQRTDVPLVGFLAEDLLLLLLI